MKVTKDLIYSVIFGRYVSLPQHEKSDGSMTITGENNPMPTQFTGSNMELFGLSTDPKPTPDKVGVSFFEIDTTNAYMWDGTQWRLI